MGDVGDYWNDHRDYKKRQKAKDAPRIERLSAILEGMGAVRLSDSGPHLRINGVLDFWPSTGTARPLRGSAKADVEYARSLINRARRKQKEEKG